MLVTYKIVLVRPMSTFVKITWIWFKVGYWIKWVSYIISSK